MSAVPTEGCVEAAAITMITGGTDPREWEGGLLGNRLRPSWRCRDEWR
jgi:hypothetical protein